MRKEFKCEWEHPKYFSAIKLGNMKTLFKNLGIELIDVKEEQIKRRVKVMFTLKGTEEQYYRLKDYMVKIRAVS